MVGVRWHAHLIGLHNFNGFNFRVLFMAFARVNNVVLHFSEYGRPQLPALVFVNSLGTDFRIWDSVVSVLDDRTRVLLYDKRGHGLSDGSNGSYSLDDHVDDLLALLDHLDLSRVAVVGLSIGGMIAQRLAVRAPSRVSALVLCDTAAKIGTPELWAERIKAIERNGLAAIADTILERWFSRDFRKNKPDELAGWRNMLVRTPVEGYLGACAAIRDTDLSLEVASIKAPTLCVAGDEDGATPPDLVKGLAGLIPNARFSLITGAGHLPCIEQPSSLIQLIDRHLQEAELV